MKEITRYTPEEAAVYEKEKKKKEKAEKRSIVLFVLISNLILAAIAVTLTLVLKLGWLLIIYDIAAILMNALYIVTVVKMGKE